MIPAPNTGQAPSESNHPKSINSIDSSSVKISQFAQKVGFPMCSYFEQAAKMVSQSQEEPIQFLSGDPTKYNRDGFSIGQKGYQILRQHIRNPTAHGYTRTNGVPDAAKAVLQKLYSKSKVKVGIENVFIGHNVNHSLMCVLMAFTNPGDNILVPEAGYPFFEELAPSMGVHLLKYRLKEDCNFQIDLGHVRQLITDRTQFIYVVNPSNPMGSVFTRKHMEEIISCADELQLPIVVDEVYAGQSFKIQEWESFGTLTHDVPVIVASGVQKIFSVPGWSLSWLVMFDKHKYLQRIHRNLQIVWTIFLHPNKFTQCALPQLLATPQLMSWNRDNVRDNAKATHDYLIKQLGSIDGLHPYPAQGTTYIAVKIQIHRFAPINTDQQFLALLHSEENVKLLPLSTMGSLVGFRMITCHSDRTVYEKLVLRLRRFVDKRLTQQK